MYHLRNNVKRSKSLNIYDTYNLFSSIYNWDVLNKVSFQLPGLISLISTFYGDKYDTVILEVPSSTTFWSNSAESQKY